MKTLTPKSQAILDLAILHRDRCLQICLYLGEEAADDFHLKFKGEPAGERARQEFERLISVAGN